MSSKTKIVVLHTKEVVYTVIFLALAIMLGILLFVMFGRSHSDAVTETSTGVYQPGVYASSIKLNDNTFDVAVTVDSDRIKSIALVNLSESTAAMYPLMEPALEEIASQIYSTQSTENITFSEESQYTSTLLLEAVESALEKAKIE
ncbi:MAG: hypothetical protein UHS54_03655 [Lachnospiraceae bacterium]|nr:hypothetical protein [Lachnospiraceae bacterium]